MSQTQSLGYMLDGYDSETLDFDEDILDFDSLFSVETVTTADRLAKYPEMYNFRPMCRRKKLFGFPEPAEGVSSAEAKYGIKDVIVEPEKLVLTVVCPECGRWFRSARVLEIHKLNHEEGTEESIKSRRFLCPYEECSTQCDCQMTLNEHVRSAHEKNDLMYETMQFPNWIEFERWKESLEYDTTSRFVQSSGRYNSTGKSVRYVCFFSRTSHNPPKRLEGVRKRPSRKLSRACTAYMHVRDVYGLIHVRVCLTHCGHETLIHQLPLSNTIKKEIAAELLRGTTEDHILENFRESCTPADRRFYIRPYEIRNVYQKMIKTHQTFPGTSNNNNHPEDVKCVRITVEKDIPEVDREEIV